MAEGRSDDYEMRQLGEKYPEYDDMNYEQLDYEYNHI